MEIGDKVVWEDTHAVVSSILICTSCVVQVHQVMVQSLVGAGPIAYASETGNCTCALLIDYSDAPSGYSAHEPPTLPWQATNATYLKRRNTVIQTVLYVMPCPCSRAVIIG